MTEAEKRELLEMAAWAAGVRYDPELSKPHPTSGAFWGLWLLYDREPTEHDRRHWNPLTDDGDCARLEAALGIDVEWWGVGVIARKLRGLPHPDIVVRMLFDDRGGDRNAARRAASVAVAAEIGRQMQGAEGNKEGTR